VWIVDQRQFRDQFFRRPLARIGHNAPHEIRIDVEHAIRVATMRAGATIVHFARIEDYHVTGTAVVCGPPAPETLHTPQGDANGQRVV
jgi:hypothetical protein